MALLDCLLESGLQMISLPGAVVSAVSPATSSTPAVPSTAICNMKLVASDCKPAPQQRRTQQSKDVAISDALCTSSAFNNCAQAFTRLIGPSS
jgi:hypothetical protein